MYAKISVALSVCFSIHSLLTAEGSNKNVDNFYLNQSTLLELIHYLQP